MNGKFEEVMTVIIAGAIVHIPFTIVSTIVTLLWIEWLGRIGISPNTVILFLIWLNYYSRDTDIEIMDIIHRKD